MFVHGPDRANKLSVMHRGKEDHGSPFGAHGEQQERKCIPDTAVNAHRWRLKSASRRPMLQDTPFTAHHVGQVLMMVGKSGLHFQACTRNAFLNVEKMVSTLRFWSSFLRRCVGDSSVSRQFPPFRITNRRSRALFTTTYIYIKLIHLSLAKSQIT